MSLTNFLEERIEAEKWKKMTPEEKLKASSKIPDFIKTQFKSPANIKELVSYGLTNKSNLEKISKNEARASNDLILYRNAVPSVEDSVWLGYTFGDRMMIFRPSEVGVSKLDKAKKYTQEELNDRRDKLIDNSDFAFRVKLERIPELKAKFKREHPERKEKTSDSSSPAIVNNYKKLLAKLSIELIEKAREEIKDNKDMGEELLLLITHNKNIRDLMTFANRFNAVNKNNNLEEIKRLYTEFKDKIKGVK